ncbi:hypothetical protein SS50377_26123 [Spironucleus salmonicida]|uniref:Uncharacterized protein n=1 Tax=Spironucleus salmonicida TaxID=348837 RepID=V6LZQ4_9EUKA|nr:hypothetical protein SS50377_26123 [Spironucleus salmonicida]|eukprot:EST46329.1 Hypothetical protein SS50377_13640 [Spironucleus salmonicida]
MDKNLSNAYVISGTLMPALKRDISELYFLHVQESLEAYEMKQEKIAKNRRSLQFSTKTCQRSSRYSSARDALGASNCSKSATFLTAQQGASCVKISFDGRNEGIQRPRSMLRGSIRF